MAQSSEYERSYLPMLVPLRLVRAQEVRYLSADTRDKFIWIDSETGEEVQALPLWEDQVQHKGADRVYKPKLLDKPKTDPELLRELIEKLTGTNRNVTCPHESRQCLS